jgi:hypothetical protein
MALPLRGCRVCGDPVLRGARYCPPCDDDIREMVDEMVDEARERYEEAA